MSLFNKAAGQVVLSGNTKIGTMLLACFGATTVGTSIYEKFVDSYIGDLVRKAFLDGVKRLGDGAKSVGGGDGGGSGGSSSELSALQSAVKAMLSRGQQSESAILDAVDTKLSRAMDRMENLSRAQSSQVHVIGRDGGSGSGFSTTTVVVCCLGASGVAVGYLWKGKYVTRQHLASAVNAVTGGLSAVSKTVESLRSQVKDGLGDLTQRVEYGLGVQEEIMDSVGDLKDDMAAVHDVMSGCEQHLIASASKQDMTMRGVQLLCGVVAESLALNDSTTRSKLLEFVAQNNDPTITQPQYQQHQQQLLPPSQPSPRRRSSGSGGPSHSSGTALELSTSSSSHSTSSRNREQRSERRQSSSSSSSRKRRVSGHDGGGNGRDVDSIYGSPKSLSSSSQLPVEKGLTPPSPADRRRRTTGNRHPRRSSHQQQSDEYDDSDLTPSPSNSPEPRSRDEVLEARASAGRAAFARYQEEAGNEGGGVVLPAGSHEGDDQGRSSNGRARAKNRRQQKWQPWAATDSGHPSEADKAATESVNSMANTLERLQELSACGTGGFENEQEVNTRKMSDASDDDFFEMLPPPRCAGSY